MGTKEKWICVSRPRRFGKTFALEMLDAYYTKSGDAEELFDGLEIKRSVEFYKHLNKHKLLLCERNSKPSVEELTEWYDGYYVEGVGEVYNPKSVTEALGEGFCKDYWSKTGGFNELEEYVSMNFDGLRDDIICLLAGERAPLNVVGFSNDLENFEDKEEVLTALIHLGYLTYKDGFVRIPNRELREEFSATVKRLNWGTVSKLLNQSRHLLNATLQMDEEKVAQLLEDVHDDMQEFKEYNNEHTLKCVIHLAYYAAADLYELLFETPAGKGYADCIMRPKRNSYPGIVIELKYNKSTEDAMSQMEAKQYQKVFADTVRQILLVAVNYDKKTKKHQCQMKMVQNN